MESSLFNEEEVKAEVKQQSDYLNVGFGFVVFTLALACMGTPNPSKSAWFCALIVAALAFNAAQRIPVTIRTLRELEKETKDAHVIEVRKYLENKYLGAWPILRNNFLYWAGLGFYLAILLSPEFVSWLSK